MLHVHRATRADRLVDRLGDLLATPPADPFDADVVAVHSRGIERWVAQRLAHRLGTGGGTDGVTANVEFPFPGTIVRRALAGVGGNQAPTTDATTDGDDPWDPDRLAFTLLDLWERGDLADVDLGGFGLHVATGRHRRLPAFRHAAGLLDDYQQHRPELVRAWAAWDGTGAPPDGRGGTIPDHLAWQARLLGVARDHVGTTRADAIATAVDGLRRGTGPVPGLPPRMSLFALTALAAAHFEVLAALVDRVEVHVFLLHPSPAGWERDRTVAAAAPPPASPRPARSATPLVGDGHPLVTGWGRDSRELQVLLGGAGTDASLDPAPTPPGTLLERLQSDIVANCELPTDQRWPLDPDDRSVQVHAAHGLHRQVEVARDAVLEALAEDPTLEPRDIVVMTPDVETFAPLVTASFRAAATPGSGIPDVRVRLADRALRVTNPVLVALGDLLALVDERFEAGRVLDLLRHEPVRATAGIAEDDLELLAEHVDRAQVKWGLDEAHRRDHGLDATVNTWRAGVDRMLTGVVAPDTRLVDGVVPLADPVNAGLVGALAEFVARLRHVRAVVLGHAGEHTMAGWRRILGETADLLLDDGHDAWPRWQLDGILTELAEVTGEAAAPVTLSELRGLLDMRLAGRPSRADHQTGDLTVCSLVPMRTVPFRVIVVVGLDDGSWPRQRTRSGDDLLGLVPVVGDRDPASEDRQLLLDALMAARDRLVITFRGAHQSTNQPVPPSVVVAELLDVVDDTAIVATNPDRRPADVVVTRHPLRAADVRTFRDGRPRFDRLAAAGAMAAQAEREHVTPLVFDPPVAVAAVGDTLGLDELARILANPSRAWMRHAFGFVDRDLHDARDDNLAVEATGLAGWSLGSDLVNALVVGQSVTDVVARLRDAGALPVGRLAEASVADHLPTARAIATAHHEALGTAEAAPEIAVDLVVAGTRLRGIVRPTVAGRLVRTSYSRFKPGNLLGGWIRAVAATAAGTPVGLVDVAKSPSSSAAKLAIAHEVGALDRSTATAVLEELVAVARWVRTRPTPLFANTSGAYWSAMVAGKGDAAAVHGAGGHWSAGWPERYGEGHDVNVRRMFGDAPLAVLARRLPTVVPDDAPAWWHDDDLPHDLARWARRVYDPVWQAAEVRDIGPVEEESP